MRRFIALSALALAISGPALALDTAVEDVIGKYKALKPVPIADIAILMMEAERWCYNQQGDQCQWSEIYLSTEDDVPRYEISNAWDEDVDISYINYGEFRDGRFICDVGNDWIASVRAFGRDDNLAIEGRALEELRNDIRTLVSPADADDCYDYLYNGKNESAQTVTLTQRLYPDGGTEHTEESTVTLHFDKANADEMGWYW